MAKKSETFESFISRERARLKKARDAALKRKSELDQELEGLERELAAIGAYEKAKGGRPRKAAAKKGRPAARAGKRAPRGEKRKAVLQLIRGAQGLSRGDILLSMGVKGNKSGEQSVSNTLTALKKQNVIESREGKYYAS